MKKLLLITLFTMLLMAPVGYAANFGFEDVAATVDALEFDRQAIVATPAGDGTATSITVYLAETTTNNAHAVDCALYNDATDAWVATTSSRTNITTTAAWYQFDFPTPPSIYSTITYAIACQAGSGSGNINMYYNAEAGNGREMGLGGEAWPDPIVWDNDPYNRKYSIYVTYTPTGSLINTADKRASVINLLLPFGRVLPTPGL